MSLDANEDHPKWNPFVSRGLVESKMNCIAMLCRFTWKQGPLGFNEALFTVSAQRIQVRFGAYVEQMHMLGCTVKNFSY